MSSHRDDERQLAWFFTAQLINLLDLFILQVDSSRSLICSMGISISLALASLFNTSHRDPVLLSPCSPCAPLLYVRRRTPHLLLQFVPHPRFPFPGQADFFCLPLLSFSITPHGAKQI